ncbi:MAG TPA: YicC/YloC family endoribonuclease, partial [Gammaproteobacteria bacterium]|nr:YicC/YloC family endoribonuclease [Gammaproteobacteria bacterium]
MIYSMTAFARLQQQGDWGTLVCEMRSINHRYLEMSVYLPETLRIFEPALREQIRAALKRGKVECSFRYQPVNDVDHTLNINNDLVQALCCACENIAKLMPAAAA